MAKNVRLTVSVYVSVPEGVDHKKVDVVGKVFVQLDPKGDAIRAQHYEVETSEVIEE